MKRVIPIAIVLSIAIALPLGYYGHTAGAIWGAVIIVVTAGGSIAYLGDVIGYSLGKKRVTLFGLRPRDSAKVIGIIAGAVSALAAGMVLLLIDGAFRVALFTGHELAHKLIQQRAQNASLGLRIEKSAAILRDAEKDKRVALAARDAAEVDLTRANRTLFQARGQLAKTQAVLSVRLSELDTDTRAIAALKAQAADLEARNHVAMQQYDEIENKITTEAIPTIKVARSSKLVYRNGQEVGRGTIHNGSKPEIVARLNEMLDTLGKQAEALGAGRSGYKRAVKLAWLELKARSSHVHGTSPSFVSEAELIDALADQIRASNSDSVVVIATSLGNSFEGLPAILQLHPYRNHVVLHAGTVLGEVTLNNNGTLKPDEIVTAIQRLLIMKVRPTAIDAGVIPVLESAGAQPQLGNLPVSDLLLVVTQVEALKGQTTISALTSADIWSGDQLQLRFTVRSGNSSGAPAQ